MKRIIALVLILFLVLLLVPAQASVKTKVTEKNVWLRDKSGNIIDEIPVGTQITVESYNSSLEMFSVSYGNKSGYIKGTGLSVSTSSLRSQLSSQKSNSNGKVSLNAQAAYNLAQKSNANSVKKNGGYVTCSSTYNKNGKFSMEHTIVTNSYDAIGWDLVFYDKTTLYDIKPEIKLSYLIVSTKPTSISITTNGSSTTLPSSAWEYVKAGLGIFIDFTERLNLLRNLVQYGGSINLIYSSSTTKIDFSKNSLAYQGLKTVFAVWQEAGLDDLYGNTAKVTAPPTAKPAVTPSPKPTATPTKKPEGFDINILEGSKYYKYDKFSKKWNVQTNYKKEYSDSEIGIYILLFDTYVEKGWGPELRILYYDKKNTHYNTITAFRAAIDDTIYRFEKMQQGEDASNVLACNTLKEFCNALVSGKDIAFQIDHTDIAGKSWTTTIDPVNKEDLKKLIELIGLLNNSDAWSIRKDLESYDKVYGASIE